MPAGFYDRHILPKLIDFACGMGQITEQRKKILPRASGRVLEVGIGSGLNLALLDPRRVTAVVGLDPSEELLAYAQRRARDLAFPVEFIVHAGEAIPLEPASVDTILVTYALCTIPGVEAALNDMRRVLKPHGRLLFCEHGRAPEFAIQRWQDRLTPFWQCLAGGCHLNRDIPALLRDRGFRIETLEAGYLAHAPRFVGYHYIGSAAPG
jgi:SAM-dependent methyltransferase